MMKTSSFAASNIGFSDPAVNGSWAHSPSHPSQPSFDTETRRNKRKSFSSRSSRRSSTLTTSSMSASTPSRYYRHRRTDSAISATSPTSPWSSIPASPAALPSSPAWPFFSDFPVVSKEGDDPPILFNMYNPSPLTPRKLKTYTIALSSQRSGKEIPAFHVSFPHSMLGPHFSKPHILVQRGNESGPVVGEVRYRSIFGTDEIHLPSLSASAGPETTALSSDGLFTRRKRVKFAERNWFWKGMSGGGWKCLDDEGEVAAVVLREITGRVIRIAVLKEGLTDRAVEGIVVTGLAVLEKDDRGTE